MALDETAAAYLNALTARLGSALGDTLVAVYLIGSGALDAYVPGRSDLDVLVIVRDNLAPSERDHVLGASDHGALPCPASKLELVVMTAAAASQPRRGQAVELNVNTGSGLGLQTPEAGWHWFVADLAVARAHGQALHGPAACELIGTVERALALEALAETVAWYVREEPGQGAVVAAARAWRYAETDQWVTKQAALEWAAQRLRI